MFEAMKNLGMEIKEQYPGIYYVSGKQALFDTQIVVTKQLDKETHRTLRILSKHVREEDVRAFVEKAVRMSEPGDRNNVDAVLQVSVSANKEIRETKQETLLEAIRNLMETMKCSADQAMAALKIPEADKGKYIAKL